MQPSAPSDPELLADWLGRQRESAFHALVARYAGLVYATAKRTCGDDSMAAEASQLTFIALAQKAKSLAACASLGGWLHLTAMMQAKNLIRKSQRESRKRQLLQAAMDTEPPHTSSDVWQEMQPQLDEALAALSAKDREALLLRFYRSLTIREIAATLCIATDAAQKRIDRAIERLRGKLARRGYQAGGSLGAVMFAGFTADAQAAIPAVSLLAPKALAAGAASAITSTAIITALTTAMKSTSFIIPAVALISTVALIAMQRQSIGTLERETALLQNRITASDSSTSLSSTAKPVRPKAVATGDEPINWNEFVSKHEEMRQRGRLRSENMGWAHLIEERLQSMTKEQLSAELERITALDVPSPYPDLIREMVMTPLTNKAPELGLMRFMEHPSSDSDNWSEPNAALKQWAMTDPEKATAWLDAQITAGKLDSKSLDGKNPLRILFEKTLIGVLITSDPDAASHRVGILPENQRADVLRGQAVEPKNQGAFAKLVRQQVPATDQTEVLAELVFLSVPKEGYGAATGCLDRIEATPDERTAYIEHVAVSHFQHLARNGGITNKEVDALREWTDSISPEATNLLTGKALAMAPSGGGNQTSYADLAELAVQYNQAGGNDDVLVGFLKEPVNYVFNRQLNKQQVSALAEKIADEKRRQEVLDLLDQYFPKP